MANPRILQAELKAALLENERLREENRRLKEVLASHSNVPSPPEISEEPLPTRPAVQTSIFEIAVPTDKPAKVGLFRSLFRGREDIYAIRWRMKNGKWGYRPDDKKDWNAVLTSRPERSKEGPSPNAHPVSTNG